VNHSSIEINIAMPHLPNNHGSHEKGNEEKRLHNPHHENIVRLWDVAPRREELHQVMELPMDVTANRHGAVHRLNVRLFDEDLLHLDNQ